MLCYGCNKPGHKIKDCPAHAIKKDERRLNAGEWAEYLCSKILCPNCKDSPLVPVQDKCASLDLECSKKGCPIEVKSRCLSNSLLPEYIKIHGGSYETFRHRIMNEKLVIIVILYRVDEKKDKRILRGVYYINNETLQKGVIGSENFIIKNGITGATNVMCFDRIRKHYVEIKNRLAVIRNEKKSFIVIPCLSQQAQKI